MEGHLKLRLQFLSYDLMSSDFVYHISFVFETFWQIQTEKKKDIFLEKYHKYKEPKE